MSMSRTLLSGALRSRIVVPTPLLALRTFSTTSPIPAPTNVSATKGTLPIQSTSPHAPLGVLAALAYASDPSALAYASDPSDPSVAPRSKLADEFSLADRVALVSGGNRGLGLEMAMALAEAGARAVYCVDLPERPGRGWEAVRAYVEEMGRREGRGEGKARLEYVSGNVTDQKGMWEIGEMVAKREGRMDVGIAAAGILRENTDCLEYPAEEFKKVHNVNVNGVLFTAQAVGRQMVKFGTPGSIILIASMSGSITNKDHAWVSYNSSKSAVLQMGRSMACELGPKKIRVNTLSPGHIYTTMTAAYGYVNAAGAAGQVVGAESAREDWTS